METRKIKDLTPYDRNPRKNKAAVDKVLESLNRHGQVKGIVLSAKGKPFTDEVICCGHTTVEALKRFGAKEAKVIIKEFADEAQFIDYNIRDNKAGEFAEWDDQLLADLSAEFEIDLDEMGFEDIDMEEPTEGNTDEDDVPEVPEEPTAKLGQIWKLGDHRLMCGDSTDKATVEALMDGEKADMVFTDPPYGISIVAGSKVGGSNVVESSNFAEIIGDDTIETALKSIEIIKEMGSDVQIIWGGNYYANALDNSSCWIVWDKENSGNFADCELAWTNQKTAVRQFKHMWNGMVKASEHGQKRVHPTQKPIALTEWCLQEYGKDCETVLDLFGGSGSTLMGCEAKGKACFMMEFSPAYIDVIIKRWESFTGKKAELLNAI